MMTTMTPTPTTKVLTSAKEVHLEACRKILKRSGEGYFREWFRLNGLSAEDVDEALAEIRNR